MKTIFVLLAIALVVAIGFLVFADAGPRRVIRRRVQRPARVRRRVVTEEIEDLE
ncbi:MAG: hypothetical protein ACR2J0_00890 [Mycobacteriales bacterium]